ncbi:hypothetical protein POTOM_020720 [Populus tomentosa]|uniref:Uncharacterized protein n=1 Tax=Populus tomentosa TaxID=118781 RepID=A0A8X7ZSQ9_POPTO|nr:hypothetical protein POTOM_020720 [Populus tomentosa]
MIKLASRYGLNPIRNAYYFTKILQNQMLSFWEFKQNEMWLSTRSALPLASQEASCALMKVILLKMSRRNILNLRPGTGLYKFLILLLWMIRITSLPRSQVKRTAI